MDRNLSESERSDNSWVGLDDLWASMIHDSVQKKTENPNPNKTKNPNLNTHNPNMKIHNPNFKTSATRDSVLAAARASVRAAAPQLAHAFLHCSCTHFAATHTTMHAARTTTRFMYLDHFMNYESMFNYVKLCIWTIS